MVVAYRSAAVQRRWPSVAQTMGWHFQPKLLTTNLSDHKGPLLVRLAWAEARRSMGPKPFLHPWFVPVACETHLPLGQASAQALRLVGRCKYAKSALSTLLYLVTDQCRNYNYLECRQIYFKTQLSTVVYSTPTTKKCHRGTFRRWLNNIKKRALHIYMYSWTKIYLRDDNVLRQRILAL